MRLTPDLLAAAYDLLRHTAPFDKWNLPESEDVTFSVLRTTTLFGDYNTTPQHTIRLSERRHTRLTGVLATMAHEMLHLHLGEIGCAKDSARHGPAFRLLAGEVCAAHPEFDPSVF